MTARFLVQRAPSDPEDDNSPIGWCVMDTIDGIWYPFGSDTEAEHRAALANAGEQLPDDPTPCAIVGALALEAERDQQRREELWPAADPLDPLCEYAEGLLFRLELVNPERAAELRYGAAAGVPSDDMHAAQDLLDWAEGDPSADIHTSARTVLDAAHIPDEARTGHAWGIALTLARWEAEVQYWEHRRDEGDSTSPASG